MEKCWHTALWLLETCGTCGDWRAHDSQQAVEEDPGNLSIAGYNEGAHC